ncbi:MAG: RNA-binding S4 domain-containing protein [Candidatus Woesearchaeota archaeon]
MKYIELNTFLKIKGLAGSGGEAKQLIRSEKISVNNVIETRNKRKLIAGDIITYENKELEVMEEDCQKKLEN